jgi:hypothetical protein
MAYTFSKSSSDVKGITEVSVNGPSHEFNRVSGFMNAPIIIAEAGGLRAVFIAESCLKALQIDRHDLPTSKALRYGPGARRVFIEVTETTIDKISAAGRHARTSRNGTEFSNSISYNQDVQAFALALIDLL